jgi:hypothetical protein
MQENRHPVALLVLSLLSAAPARADLTLEVKIVPRDDRQRAEVLVGGQPFTEYRYGKELKKPLLYPLRAPSGAIITRGWPLEPRGEESQDHPHHIGYWLTYGDVDGIDFWGNSPTSKDTAKKGTIVQRKWAAHGSELVTESDWLMPDGKRALAEQTTFRFSAGPGWRLVHRETRLTAGEAAVSLPDTKEGMLGLRVCRSLEHPGDKNPKGTGHYRSSEGKEGDDVWGTRARWVMLTGDTEDGKPVTVALFDHPGNPGFPTYWHARTWGLFAANPLGQKALSKGKETLAFKIPAKGSVTFRYDLVIETGHLKADEIEILYRSFTRGAGSR